MQETDRDRRGTGAADCGNGVIERAIVERDRNLAIGLQPFPYAKTPLARHQRLRRRRTQVVTVVLQPLAHLDHVAMALGGEQRDFCSFALEQSVGGDRGAVHDAVGNPEHVRARQL